MCRNYRNRQYCGKGEVKVSATSIKYAVNECSVLDFSQDAVDILSSKAQNVDVIFAAYYGENGKVLAHKYFTLH